MWLKELVCVRLWCVFAVVAVGVLPHPTAAFNVLWEEPKLITPPGQDDMQFGFSLSHLYSGGQRHLLVGAPKASNATSTGSEGTARTGALYSCPLESEGQGCTQLKVNLEEKYKPYIYKDLKDGQRLGFSLASNGKDTIVVCAPRWHIFIDTKNREEDHPLGMCYYVQGLEGELTPFSPPCLIQETRKSYLTNAACQFGISVAYIQDHDTYAFGSPGCWSWQGDTWEMGLDAVENPKRQRRVEKLSLKDVDLSEGGGSGYLTMSDLYLGFSVASITYNSVPAIVSSMPRATSTADLRVVDDQRNETVGPIVYIFEQDKANETKLKILDKIHPPYIEGKEDAGQNNKFMFFGYSLATLDYNGDGLEDLVVAAPFYNNNKTHYDQGAIFVYKQTTYTVEGGNKKSQMTVEADAPRRKGQEPYGRFGTCVAALGDIDGDNYQDLAVGAPYMEGGGAVFIYMGSAEGLAVTANQVLRASILSQNLAGPVSLSAFGNSIAKLLPSASGSGYDVAVGAHTSDAVLVFRTKEVVTFAWTLVFSDSMDLSNQDCRSPHDANLYSCVSATVCFSYRTRNFEIDRQAKNLEFSLTLTADSRQQFKRLFFHETKNETLVVTKVVPQEGEEKCSYFIVYAHNDVKEVVKPFVFRGEVRFINNNNKLILDPKQEILREEELAILVNCGGRVAKDCESDLVLEYEILKDFTLGEAEPLQVTFRVENKGETAYNTQLQLKTKGDLKVQESEGSVKCDASKINTIVCDIDTIFDTNNITHFNLSFNPATTFYDNLQSHDNFFRVQAVVITTSTVVNPDTASKTIDIPIIVEGSLELSKQPSEPPSVGYNSSSFYKSPSENTVEEELGPLVTHRYKIYNPNKFTIYSTRINITWPYKIEGKHLLYLLDFPRFAGVSPDCQYDEQVDPFDVRKKEEETLVPRGGYRRQSAARFSSSSLQEAPGMSARGVEYLGFRCILGEVMQNMEVTIEIQSRLVMATIRELNRDVPNVTSTARLEVLQMPLGAPLPSLSHPYYVTTDITNQVSVVEVPWWVYALSILGGILLLVVIVFGCYKCGFFKRQKINQAETTSLVKPDEFY